MELNIIHIDILCNFVDQCNLLTPLIDFDVHSESFSFVPKQTMLDYILVNNNIDVHHYEILVEGSLSSTSDHLPIVAPKRCLTTIQVPTPT